MATVQVRFSGGPLDGRQLWIQDDQELINVQVGEHGGGVSRVLQYRRDGEVLRFVSEVDPGAVPPRPVSGPDSGATTPAGRDRLAGRLRPRGPARPGSGPTERPRGAA